MGYDMYFRGKRFTDGDEVCFRLNIFGMARFADYMAERGMIFEAGQHPPFPEGGWDAHYRLRWPEDYKDEPTTLSDEQIKALAAQVDEVLAWHGPEVPGIPAHKFGSNDGWIVTPAECEAAWRLGKDQPAPPDHEEYWAKWLDYLHRAASNGGFEVH